MGRKHKPSSSSRLITYDSYGEDMRIYLYHVARIYHMISGGISMKIGDEEITLGDEEKKLLALYLAAGFDNVRHEVTKTMLQNSEAYQKIRSKFEVYTSSRNRNISVDEASQIISQDFSELLNHRTNKFYTKKISYPGPSTLIVMQTLKVASVKETNPIYWFCKMADGINNTNLAENYVSSIFSMYKSAIKHNYLGAVFPLTLSAFEKKVSFEKKKEVPKKLKSDSGIHGVSSERDKQSEIASTMQVRQSSEVEHGKLNNEAGAESKQVDEEQKSSEDVELSEIDRWLNANQVVNDFLKEIIPENEWSRINQEGVKKALELGMILEFNKKRSNELLGAEDIEAMATAAAEKERESRRWVDNLIDGKHGDSTDTVVSHGIPDESNLEADETLFAIIDTVTDGNSEVSHELLNLIKEYGGDYYPQYPGICILADCVRLYKENGCDLNEVLSGRRNKLAEENFVYILRTIKKIEEMPRKSLAKVTSMDEPLKWHHENNPVPKNYYGSISKTRKSRTYASDTIKSTTTSSFSSSSLGTSDSSELGKMFGDKSIGDASKSDDKERHF